MNIELVGEKEITDLDDSLAFFEMIIEAFSGDKIALAHMGKYAIDKLDLDNQSKF